MNWRLLSSGGDSRVLVLLVVSLLLAVPLLPAEDSDARDVLAFFDSIEVPLSNVDVVVSDAEGRPVTDLTAADFELYEDGRRVEISHFHAPDVPGADTTADGPESSGSTDKTLSLVVFFDDRGLAPRQRREAIEELRRFLGEAMPPNLRLMIATSDGRSTTRTPLTGDPSRLLPALEQMALETRPRPDVERERILRDLLRTAGAFGPAGTNQPIILDPMSADRAGAGPGGSQKTAAQLKVEELAREASRYVATIRSYAVSQRQRAERLFADLELLIRALGPLPGRKAIALIGGELENRPGEGLFVAWEQAFPEVARQMHVSAAEEARRHEIGPEIERLSASAGRHRVCIFTVSSPASTSSGISAEGVGMSGDSSIARGVVGSNALLEISRSSGGLTLSGSAELADGLEQVVRDVASGYSLGYRPGQGGEGEVRTIAIEVRDPDLSVRHPERTLRSSTGDRLEEHTISAALLGAAHNPIGLEVELREPGVPQADGEVPVPVLVKVPIDRLMLRPEGEQHAGQITALVIVQSEGRISQPQSWRYPIHVANDQLMDALGGKAGMVLNLEVSTGPQRIAVGVRDDVAGSVWTAILDLDLSDRDERHDEL